MATADEAEIEAEVEAVQAVYGDDCVVIDSYPPHLHVHIKPRTADVTSQQFVEAVIVIRAGSQYPKEPPHINLLDSNGLDDRRQKDLITCIQDKACELSSYLMLVALCEEAVEKLTVMNHPDGDCPLCLYPLLPEDEQNKTLPFMKLMSCFHCFHSECIIRWWHWLQTEKETSVGDSSSATIRPISTMENKADTRGAMEESMGTCPVCRKVFLAKDFEHVLDLVASHSSQLNFHEIEVDDNQKLLESDSEDVRREKFEAILRLQQENNGLIEPKKNLVVVPGMFLLQTDSAASTSAKESPEQPQIEATGTPEAHSSGSSTLLNTSVQRRTGMRKHRAWNPRKQVKQSAASPSTMSTRESGEQQGRDPAVTLGTHSVGSISRPSTSELRTSGMRKQRHWNSRKPVEKWIRKENATSE
ncbi:uncharacterized protein LOC132188679 [Corylus avellana]|uniref:uncharacterized protein LOC132188679 n=1 Tax=Corylus avellana TaxID=13451 RepID=UPI001E236977|nr:uncharacterized protein LOC132188679 [Corylus avellana]